MFAHVLRMLWGSRGDIMGVFGDVVGRLLDVGRMSWGCRWKIVGMCGVVEHIVENSGACCGDIVDIVAFMVMSYICFGNVVGMLAYVGCREIEMGMW